MTRSVAIVAIARNEGQYINNWIDYHRKLGISHFYIYDNSFDGETRLDDSIENKENVTVIPYYNKIGAQKKAYREAYSSFGGQHDYMLFIDIDEFLTLMKHDDIQDYLDFIEGKCPGVQQIRFHWEIYNDNDTIERDLSIPVQDFFTSKRPDSHNNITKSMLKTKMPNMKFASVHWFFSTTQSLIECDGSGNSIHSTSLRLDPIDIETAKIRHYITKTLSEFMNQQIMSADTGQPYNIETKFFKYNKRTKEKIQYYEQHRGGLND